MNIIDIIIVLFIIMGAIIGMKRGVIKQGVMTIGMLLVLILSFILKNPVSAFMYKYLPFFNLYGLLDNLSILNILLYELIAFALVFGILSSILAVLIKISGIIERILKGTIILAIPSKILGLILGAFEYYLVVFVILFILSGPTFKTKNFDFINESKLKDPILNNTIIISNISEKTVNTFNEVGDLIKKKSKNKIDDTKFNCKALDIMIKNEFLSKDSANYLKDKGKINTNCN